MAKWNSLFVNEMNHVYSKFISTKDETKLNDILSSVLNTNDVFKRAYMCGLVDYLHQQGLYENVEITDKCILNPPVFPMLYYRPEFIKQMPGYVESAIPEFKRYGIIIRQIGDSA